MIAIENPTRCGIGEGDNCCAFLVAGAGGFECGREMEGIYQTLRTRLAAGTITAKYDPGTAPFPACQIERPR